MSIACLICDDEPEIEMFWLPTHQQQMVYGIDAKQLRFWLCETCEWQFQDDREQMTLEINDQLLDRIIRVPSCRMFDLTGWNRVPEQRGPLTGQMNLFDVYSPQSFVSQCNDEPSQLGDQSSQPGDQPELFDCGRDLPGAGERVQHLLWDVA